MDSTEEAHMNNEPTHYLSQSQTNQSLLKIKKTSPNSALIRRKKLTQKHSLSNNKALLNKENHLINLSKIKNQNFEKSKKGFVKTYYTDHRSEINTYVDEKQISNFLHGHTHSLKHTRTHAHTQHTRTSSHCHTFVLQSSEVQRWGQLTVLIYFTQISCWEF